MRWAWVCLLFGCLQDAEPAPGPTSCTSRNYFDFSIQRNVDVLLVVDDSQAMASLQATLAANAATFATLLEQEANTSLDLHVGVTTGSSTGGFFDPGNCGILDGRQYLEDLYGGRTINFASFSDSLSCLLHVGTGGSVEQRPLEATRAALTNPANAGFVRQNSLLLVVIITPQDDASPEDVPVYVDTLKALEPNPSRVTSSVVGRWPAPRLSQFLDSFAYAGTFTSIDQDNWSPAFQILTARISGIIGHQCVDGVLPIPPPTPGTVVDPSSVDCTARRVQWIGTPEEQEVGSIPPCNPAGQPTGPCWALIGQPQCSTSRAEWRVCYDGFDPTMQTCPRGPLAASADGETDVVECEVACR